MAGIEDGESTDSYDQVSFIVFIAFKAYDRIAFSWERLGRLYLTEVTGCRYYWRALLVARLVHKLTYTDV